LKAKTGPNFGWQRGDRSWAARPVLDEIEGIGPELGWAVLDHRGRRCSRRGPELVQVLADGRRFPELAQVLDVAQVLDDAQRFELGAVSGRALLGGHRAAVPLALLGGHRAAGAGPGARR
jgi:hypothetical protein